jgi:V8-like Glu-specific endopeptidase
MRLPHVAALALVVFGSVSMLAFAQSPLPPEQHYGEIADPSVWPISAVGRVNIISRTDSRAFCTGTLVAPNLVLTAAHCVFQDPGARNVVHFVTAVAKGVPSEHSVAKRFVISPKYVSGEEFHVEDVPNDWALIVLADALTTKPVPVRGLAPSQLANAGPFMHVGYGADRPFLPSVVRDCEVDALSAQTLGYRCLTNHGYSGAPILAQVDGTYWVIGIVSWGNQEKRAGYACSAVQFEKAVADLLKAE